MRKKPDIDFVDLKYVDLIGKLRHLSFPISYWETAKEEGAGFDSSSLKGFKKTEKSDMVLLPDVRNSFIDPFYSDKTQSYFAKMYYNDKRTRYERDPRYILEQAASLVKKELKADKILFLPELEFYVFSEFRITNTRTNLCLKLASDEKESFVIGAYHQAPPHDFYSEHRNHLVKLLQGCGIEVKYHHHEGGAFGQLEIETTFADALKTADNIIIAKYIIKNYFKKRGLYATFIPKPLKNAPGSGMHYHHLIEKDGKSLFKGKNEKLSLIGENYIKGILSHLTALCAFTNPTTNSYKRLTGGYETPKTASIGLADRTSAIRIPGYAKDKMVIEYRVGDGTCNPYLSLAALLLAGLDGVRNKGNLKAGKVPTSLISAINALKEDTKFLTQDNIFPEEIINFWIEAKSKEEQEISYTPHPIEFVYYFDL
jgi:glutamine synthetase